MDTFIATADGADRFEKIPIALYPNSTRAVKDVAREVGLSETAVSQVLNNRPCRISEQSKERIREAARRLNYRANEVARGLAMRRSASPSAPVGSGRRAAR